jgi:hypothetical protein
VPASGDSEDDCGEADGIGRGPEVLGENLPQCPYIHHISGRIVPKVTEVSSVSSFRIMAPCNLVIGLCNILDEHTTAVFYPEDVPPKYFYSPTRIHGIIMKETRVLSCTIVNILSSHDGNIPFRIAIVRDRQNSVLYSLASCVIPLLYATAAPAAGKWTTARSKGL